MGSRLEKEEDASAECCRRGFFASIKDTAARILADPTVAPKAIAQDRLSICRANTCGHFNLLSDTCMLCGCHMPLKVTMANMRCPVDLWVEWKRDSLLHSLNDSDLTNSPEKQ